MSPGPCAVVIGGAGSGCGKTSLTLGLLRALRRRGFVVQPFKAGPDFIDPGLHECAAGRVSHNLDTWMQPWPALRGIFARACLDADIAVVEGAMGIFDGRGGADETGSTAQLAKLLGLPALLVFNAAAQARSAAALALGFHHFDPDLRLLGFVANRVGSPRHAAILREAFAASSSRQMIPPLLGCLPRRENLGLASRHLGLVTAADAAGAGDWDARLTALADWVEQGVDLDALLDALPRIDSPELADGGPSTPIDAPRVRLGVAEDRAFCFRYAENLRLLTLAGADIVPFSPLADAGLPPELDGLYLPGGYPELTAAELAANAAMRASVRAFCASGRPVWAECGGYMYLLEELTDAEGRVWPMCGALPGRAAMGGRIGRLGYREARTLAPGPLGPAGTPLRGHEFHYSAYDGAAPDFPAFALTASDGRVERDGQARGNIVAGYFHAHLSSNPDVAAALVASCRAAR